MSIIGRRGRGVGLLLLLLLLSLSVAACDTGGKGAPPVAASSQSLVAETGSPLPQETPTALPPTATPTATPTPTPPAPLAAMVNGEYVFLADYERRIAQYEQALLDIGVDLDSAEGQAELAQAPQQVLAGFIDEVLIKQGGAALGIVLSEEELQAQFEADIATGGGQAAFEEWLAATGQSQEEYTEMLRRSLIVQRVWEVVTADVPEQMEQVHARTIAVDSEEAARQILAQLQGGADFATLAREQSLDLGTRDSGGDLGWFPRGVVAPELEEAAFGLQAGEIAEPILLGELFHVVQVVEREAARPLAFEMLMNLQQSRFDQWVEDQRARAVIERFVGE